LVNRNRNIIYTRGIEPVISSQTFVLFVQLLFELFDNIPYVLFLNVMYINE